MIRSIIPGFIKRKSMSSVKEEEPYSDLFKETDRSRQLSADTSADEIRQLREKYGLGLDSDRRISQSSQDLYLPHLVNNNRNQHKTYSEDEFSTEQRDRHRHSVYEGIFGCGPDLSYLIPTNFPVTNSTEFADTPMVDQEDIIALTRHVRSFSDALNNLRNTFKESCVDGVYNDAECQSMAHSRLSDVLAILKGVLAKYPPLHSPDILNAAANIIAKIKSYDYADGENGPIDFYAAIDQLALSFSSSVSDFLMGDKDMTSANLTNATLDHDDDNDGDPDLDDDFEEEYDESEKFNESEDSLDRLQGSYDLQKARENTSMESDENVTPPPLKEAKSKLDTALQRADELDKTLLSIEGSVDIALQRTKVWAKYSKDILNYIERRSHLELEFSRQTAKLAQQTRSSIVEESYLPFQSIFVTALDNDVQFANNYHKHCQNQLEQIVDKLTQRQKDHDSKRSKIKTRWKIECKRLAESRENLRAAKKLYMQKQKDLEKFNKQQLEGKDDKGGFSLGKKKGQDDFKKSAEDSEEHYKLCVQEANTHQHEIEQTKSDLLLQLRNLVYQCDLTMKSVTVEYFQMMNILLSPLPIQYRALVDSSNLYEEGQQFADFVRLQQSTCNQSMSPMYHFEQYRVEGADRLAHLRHGSDVVAISSEDFTVTNALTRRLSINSAESDRPISPGDRKVKQAWGSLPRNKGSATDDTDSLSSRSLPASPQGSPMSTRKVIKTRYGADHFSDDDHGELKEAIMKSSKQMPGLFKNQKLSAAAKMHKFRKLRSPSKCKECDSYVYFNGAECERCGIICHKKCLEKLAIKCGNKRLPRKMTTFGVDFHQHLAATKRKDIPYIIEKCIHAIDEEGLGCKGIYRVSGVKSKVEKLCQQFETGGDLVDLSTTPPHFVASVLKLYLRQLPEPLLTFKQYPNYIQVAKDSMNLKLGMNEIEEMSNQDATQYEDIIRQLHEIVKKLPTSNFFTAAKLIRHLKRVADHCNENQMPSANLAIVFGPTLLRPEGNPNSMAAVMDMSHQTRAVELLILNSHIFSVNDDGEVDIGTLVGEKYQAPRRRSKKKTKIQEVVDEKSLQNKIEHRRDDSNLSVGTEFSQELMFMMESSQKRMDEDRQKAEDGSLGQLPGQAINEEYDNIDPERESDILSDLVLLPKSNVYDKSLSVASETIECESAHSRLSSQGSWPLSEGVQFGSTSPVNLPDASSQQDEDDDVWMSKFGQINLPKHNDGAISNVQLADDDFPCIQATVSAVQSMKKKTTLGRLETTTYSFSLGRNQKLEEVEEETVIGNTPTSPVSDDTSNCSDEPSPWVKRDAIERVPVRKHLKTVNIKATTNIAPQSNKIPSPELSPSGLKNTPFSLSDISSGDRQSVTHKETGHERERLSSTTSTDSERDSQQLVLKVGAASKQQREAAESQTTTNVPLSPSKSPPVVLPKPKKPLDKKSWTADLIKSKSQSLPEPPHPGSLNDKLLSRRQDDDIKQDEVRMSRTSSLNNKSVKEILTKFQNTPALSSDSELTATKSDSPNPEKDIAEEKYV